MTKADAFKGNQHTGKTGGRQFVVRQRYGRSSDETMILGFVPMSISNTQNAPLGRAVIGGLIVATLTTLVFVPCVFAILRRSRPQPEALA